MAKILIGWLGTQNDFVKADPEKGIKAGVKKDGPNYQFHKHFFQDDYDRHILLYNKKQDTTVDFMLSSLMR